MFKRYKTVIWRGWTHFKSLVWPRIFSKATNSNYRNCRSTCASASPWTWLKQPWLLHYTMAIMQESSWLPNTSRVSLTTHPWMQDTRILLDIRSLDTRVPGHYEVSVPQYCGQNGDTTDGTQLIRKGIFLFWPRRGYSMQTEHFRMLRSRTELDPVPRSE